MVSLVARFRSFLSANLWQTLSDEITVSFDRLINDYKESVIYKIIDNIGPKKCQILDHFSVRICQNYLDRQIYS